MRQVRKLKAVIAAWAAFCAGVAVIITVPAARADTTLNFDALPVGPVAGQLAGAGLLFGDGFVVKNGTDGGRVVVPSAPNYLDLDRSLTPGQAGIGVVTFVSPLDANVPAVTDYVVIPCLALNNFDGAGWYNGIRFVAFDIDGLEVDTQVLQPTVKPNGRSLESVQLDGPAIHGVRMTLIDSPDGGNALAPSDDWQFGPLTVVPEPASGGVVFAAVWSLLWTRARRRTNLRSPRAAADMGARISCLRGSAPDEFNQHVRSRS